MVRKCSTCEKNKRVCKVHIRRSGKCSKCVKLSQRCDVWIAGSKFRRLAADKEQLCSRIGESRKAQELALKAHKKAHKKALGEVGVA